jgi:hypothetical protein
MRDENPPRVAPPRRVRCPSCGAFTRAIDRSPRHKATTRRVRTPEERAERRGRIAIRNRNYRNQESTS